MEKMNKSIKFFGIIALIGVFFACSDGGTNQVNNQGNNHTHIFASDFLVEPTCTSAGLTLQTCSSCSVTWQLYPTMALGHDHGTSGTGSLVCKRIGCTHQYAVGETGPAGGIIFYVNTEGFLVEGYSGIIGTFAAYIAYYLEAAPVNQGEGSWVSVNGVWSFSTGTAIGTGRANTNKILTIDQNSPAALLCKGYIGGGKNDWFLPSKDELDEMYNMKTTLGISFESFLSSSLYNGSNVWVQNFSDDRHEFWYSLYNDRGQGFVLIHIFSGGHIRAIRAF